MNLDGVNGAKDRQISQSDIGAQSSYNNPSRPSFPYGVETAQKQSNGNNTNLQDLKKDLAVSAKKQFTQEP